MSSRQIKSHLKGFELGKDDFEKDRFGHHVSMTETRRKRSFRARGYVAGYVYALRCCQVRYFGNA